MRAKYKLKKTACCVIYILFKSRFDLTKLLNLYSKKKELKSGRGALTYFTSSTSQSNTRVEFGGIAPETPSAP
jgi:hypothetical protein